VALAAKTETEKSAAATTRAELVERMLVVRDMVIAPLVRERSMLSFQPWIPARDGEPRGTLAGIYRVMLPIGNFRHVTDR
jgi:hypothetical protein